MVSSEISKETSTQFLLSGDVSLKLVLPNSTLEVPVASNIKVEFQECE